jgi:hypothetical protein
MVYSKIDRPDGQRAYKMGEAIAMIKTGTEFSNELISLLENTLQQ